MPALCYYPLVSCLQQANAAKVLLANSKLRLWKKGAFDPQFDTGRGFLLGAEADYSGYPSGGVTLTTWSDPVQSASNGVTIGSPVARFAVETAVPLITNVIGGYWVETAAGDVYVVGAFPEGVPMQSVSRGFPIQVVLGFGDG